MPLPNRTNILDTLSSPTLSHKVVILGIPYIIAATWEVTPPEFLEGNAVCALGQMGLPVTSILYTSTTRGNGIEFHQMATKYYDRQDSGTNIISWDNKKTRVKKMCGHSQLFYLAIQGHTSWVLHNLLWCPWDYFQIHNWDTQKNFKVFFCLPGLFQIHLNIKTFVIFIITQ